MTQATAVYTRAPESEEAGRQLGQQLRDALGPEVHAIVVFAGPIYDHTALLRELSLACPSPAMIGCSSAGEFAGTLRGDNAACAIGFVSEDILFTPALGRHVDAQPEQAATEVVAAFRGPHTHDYRYRTALVLADALAGQMDPLIEALTQATAGIYQFVGGGAGDNAQFVDTPVFFQNEVAHNAVVALELLSKKPIGIGVQHGWEPASERMRVTGASGLRLISLNAISPVEVFTEYARRTGQHFDPDHPIPFFLHNILGIWTNGNWRLRVPLAVGEDGSITCAAEIPPGATVAIMRASIQSAAHAARTAASEAVRQLGDYPGEAAILFDCVATRLRLGADFDQELTTVADAVGKMEIVGCNTHGQIARAEGQFSGFHNCTAVVCVIPS